MRIRSVINKIISLLTIWVLVWITLGISIQNQVYAQE